MTLLQRTISSSKILLVTLLRLVKRLTAMLILALFTLASTVLMAAQPLPELLSARWASSFPACSSVSAAASSLSFLVSSPYLAAPHICTNRLRPTDTQQHHHQSHHRHYRRRCHHPFLFFQLHFSPSNLLFYATFVLLLSLVSNASPSTSDNGTNSHLKNPQDLTISGQAKQDTSDITHYEARNASSSAGPTSPILSSSPNSNHNPNVIEEFVCGDIDIRNSVSNFQKLENCTVIEGHLQIVLIDNGTSKEFENITFPKLREITDFFLLFRIMGLQSLTQLFPNLAVIRGRQLLHNYAFVVYEMLHLQEIGLQSLTNIVRGDVRIEKNPNLCFVDTIDWTRIARNYLISGNKDQNSCPSCKESCPLVSARLNNDKSIGDGSNRICWTSDICQRYSCPANCVLNNQTCSDGGQCCPSQCIGGCSGSAANPLSQACLICKNVVHKNRCYDQCPPDTFVYFNRRCVTKEQCRSMANHDDEIQYKTFYHNDMRICDVTCPVGYMENPADRHECVLCGSDCPKVCQSSIVSNIQSAESLKGCTKINGSLEIYISSGGAQIMKELEENLKDLTEISDYLKIGRSFPLISLNFLRNLKIIHGNKLERHVYSLLIVDNANLQDLWTFDNGTRNGTDLKPIQIPRGQIFFHINPKLCMSKIKKMEKYIDFGERNISWAEQDVSSHTNGDKVPCEVNPLNVSLWGIESVVVGIHFENYKLKMEDPRSLMGYLIYYRETVHRNVSIFDGRDACSTNEWTVIEFDEVDDTKPNNNTDLTHIVPNLKPYTQYALYIKTYTIASEKKGAQSDIIYFTTKPYTPSQPRNLYAKSHNASTIAITWQLPSKPNGQILYYIVRITRERLVLNHRDYCSENLNKDPHRVVTTPSPIVEPMVNVWTNKTSALNDTLPWKKDGKQCCACKNEKLKPSDVEQSIDFEDVVLNTVYVKRMNNTDNEIFTRRKRDTSNETSTESSFTVELMTELISTESSNTSSSTTTQASTTVGPDQKWQLEKKVFFGSESIFSALHHFTEYSIEVQACQDTVQNSNSHPCSITAITSVRTLPLAAADDIDQHSIAYTFGNSTNETKLKSLHIKWDAPPKPNGFILSYHIQYKIIANEQLKQIDPTICVSRSQYEHHDNGYMLELHPGNYSVRIRARSLSNFGNWTEPFHVFIEEPISQTSKYVFGIFASLAIILFIAFLTYKVHQSRSKLDYVSVNPEYMSAGLVYEPDPKWEVPRENVTLICELGQGSFGMVYQGELINDKKEVIKCAIKTVNDGSTLRERIDFLKEADSMKSFTECHHVVKLLGIVSKDQPVYVLMEIMSRGDLRKYLRDNRPDNEENPGAIPPALDVLYKIAIEIADGMAYLSSKKFVHRDLAARNCLMADDMTVKIGDFGMARDIYENDYYRKGGKGLLPVRWMSPESLKDGLFTHFSDVWSYGVVLWEMATLASQPYQGLSNEEVLKFVVDGGRMTRPDDCPEVLWDLMSKTWERKPKARPTFLKIVEMLLEHIDQKPFLDMSYYQEWKNLPKDEKNADANSEDKDDSEIELKPLSGSDSDAENDTNSQSSAGQLCADDLNVKFFPLSRNMARKPSDGQQDKQQEQSKDHGNADDAATTDPAAIDDDVTVTGEGNEKSVSLIRLNEQLSGPNESTNLLNNNLSASLANSESLSSSSTSNANLDQASTNQGPVINFSGFDTNKLGQPKEAGMNVPPSRNLINGHLINTSMV